MKHHHRPLSDTPDAKIARITSVPSGTKPVWSFLLLDTDGPWSLSTMNQPFLKEFLERLKNFESMSWSEIEIGGSHFIEIFSIIRDAQNRLETLKLDDDAERLFSLRVNARTRIWGIRDNSIFRILWWDPNHEICPSEKRHT